MEFEKLGAKCPYYWEVGESTITINKQSSFWSSDFTFGFCFNCTSNNILLLEVFFMIIFML